MRTVEVTDQVVRDTCGNPAGAVCDAVLHATRSRLLARIADIIVGAPLHILIIVVVAIVLRWLLHRAINRLVEGTLNRPLGDMLRRSRASSRLLDAGLLEIGPLAAERRHQRLRALGSVLRSLVSFVIVVVATIMVLGELGLNLAPVVASAGIVGIAVGFGAQNLVRDFLSGIFMILEDQYGVGDVIDAGSASGVVEAVGLRTTRLRDIRGTVWYVRNGEITRIGNMTQDWSRAVLDLPLAADADVAAARTLALRVADELWRSPDWRDRILERPEVVGLEQLDRDGVLLRLMVKTTPSDQWDVTRELRARLKEAFAAAGVDLALVHPVRLVRDSG